MFILSSIYWLPQGSSEDAQVAFLWGSLMKRAVLYTPHSPVCWGTAVMGTELYGKLILIKFQYNRGVYEFLVFWDKPYCPWTCSVEQTSLELRSFCLFLPNAVINGVWHHSPCPDYFWDYSTITSFLSCLSFLQYTSHIPLLFHYLLLHTHMFVYMPIYS